MTGQLTASKMLLGLSVLAALAASVALIVTGRTGDIDPDPLVRGADELLVLMQQVPERDQPLDVSSAMCQGQATNVTAITGWEHLSVAVDDAGATVVYAVTYPSTDGTVQVRVRDDGVGGVCVTQFAQSAGGR